MTCRDCFHFKACSKGSKDGLPRFVGKELACNNVEDLCDCFEDKLKVENALEKQIPKKTLLTKSPYKIVRACPVCNCRIFMEEKYCVNCGQALEWGDSE